MIIYADLKYNLILSYLTLTSHILSIIYCLFVIVWLSFASGTTESLMVSVGSDESSSTGHIQTVQDEISTEELILGPEMGDLSIIEDYMQGDY